MLTKSGLNKNLPKDEQDKNKHIKAKIGKQMKAESGLR